MCDAARCCDCVASVNIGDELTSGFVAGIVLVIVSIFCNSLCVNSCLKLSRGASLSGLPNPTSGELDDEQCSTSH